MGDTMKAGGGEGVNDPNEDLLALMLRKRTSFAALLYTAHGHQKRKLAPSKCETLLSKQKLDTLTKHVPVAVYHVQQCTPKVPTDLHIHVALVSILHFALFIVSRAGSACAGNIHKCLRTTKSQLCTVGILFCSFKHSAPLRSPYRWLQFSEITGGGAGSSRDTEGNNKEKTNVKRLKQSTRPADENHGLAAQAPSNESGHLK